MDSRRHFLGQVASGLGTLAAVPAHVLGANERIRVGFLGIGDRYHPLPWNVLTYDEDQGGYVVDLDRERLERAPSYAANETMLWDDPAYGRRVTDYYGGMMIR